MADNTSNVKAPPPQAAASPTLKSAGGVQGEADSPDIRDSNNNNNEEVRHRNHHGARAQQHQNGNNLKPVPARTKGTGEGEGGGPNTSPGRRATTVTATATAAGVGDGRDGGSPTSASEPSAPSASGATAANTVQKRLRQKRPPLPRPPPFPGTDEAPRQLDDKPPELPSLQISSDTVVYPDTTNEDDDDDDRHHNIAQDVSALTDDDDDNSESVDDGIGMAIGSDLVLLSDDDDPVDNDKKPAASAVAATAASASSASSYPTTARHTRTRSRPNPPSRESSASSTFIMMSEADIAICEKLDMEFDRALEEREIAYSARFYSVRQSACFSIVFMIIYMTLGTIFFLKQADWGVADSILFSIYTITTVGYGHLEHPQTITFQLYTIFFIFIGIATMTIVVAQMYQWFALEASRAQHARDQTEMVRRGGGVEILTRSQVGAGAPAQRHRGRQQPPQQPADRDSNNNNGGPDDTNSIIIDRPQHPKYIEFMWHAYERLKVFFTQHEIGRGMSVLFPFVGLILIGAIVIGPIERWSVVESIYFSVVSLTTVGFGDYYPTHIASICFCILWLPFSVGFMSLFLANVASFYIRLSDKNIDRIEKQLRRQVNKSKHKAEIERQAARQRAQRGGQRRDGGGDTTDDESFGDHDSGTAGAIELGTMRKGDSPQQKKKKVPTAGIPRGFDTLPTSEDEDLDDEDDEGGSVGNVAATTILSGKGHRPSSKRRRGGKLGAPATAGSPLFGSQRPSPQSRREIIQINHDQAASRGAAKSPVPPIPSQLSNDEDDNNNNNNADEVSRPRESTMSTMRDVLRAVKMNLAQEDALSSLSHYFPSAGPESEFLSIRSSQTVRRPLNSSSMMSSSNDSSIIRKPSFALRALVQERFSEIIATDVAGYSSNIEINDNTLSITIDSLKQTADKWLVPRRARRAFRAVTFEALLFVGEHGLVTRGADALYDLTLFEFHGLFAPLLAAMGDAETMEGWLSSTQVLAEVDLANSSNRTNDDSFAIEQRNRTVEPLSPISARRHQIPAIGPGNSSSSSKSPLSSRVTPGSAFAAAGRSVQYG